MKVAILVGAGSTLSDAKSKPNKSKPPLDKGFFSSCKNDDYEEFPFIKNYLKDNYDIDIIDPDYDSLEKIMAIIYADINNPLLQPDSVDAFRDLIQLFNRKIADTTNGLNINNQSNLFKIIVKNIRDGITLSDLSIITFNQDIHIEKTLQSMQSTQKYSKKGTIFAFPNCYNINEAYSKTTFPHDNSTTTFDIKKDGDEDGISIYKLHGSLNWFSTHKSKKVTKNSILSKTKRINITPRTKIAADLTFIGKRKNYAFPLIIPPVNHKSSIIHQDLQPLWAQAENKLKEADKIIVFGYSCPETDFESANMLRRTTNANVHLKSFVVIDPNPQVFHRYINITCLDYLSFFRNCKAYIDKG